MAVDRAKFEFILYGRRGLDCSPEGLTGGGRYGKGRTCGGARGPFCVFIFVQGEEEETSLWQPVRVSFFRITLDCV